MELWGYKEGNCDETYGAFFLGPYALALPEGPEAPRAILVHPKQPLKELPLAAW